MRGLRVDADLISILGGGWMMEGFPWRFALYFLAAVYLFADLYACHGPLRDKLLSGGPSWQAEGAGGVAAEVYGRPVTGLELSEALRAYLWQRDEDWSAMSATARNYTRRLVLETLVNERIVHAFRVMNGIDGERPVDAAKAELAVLRRQFEEEAVFEGRRDGQGLSEEALEERVQAAADDEAWIEEKIAHRVEELTPEDVKAWYDANAESMRVPRVWRASHIYLTRHDPEKKGDRVAEMLEIERRLKAGEASFEELAAEVSEDERTKRRGGDLGWFSAERMPEDFIAQVEKLTTGRVSAPVATGLGWHLIRLDGMRESRVPAFEEAGPEIAAKLLSERRLAAVKSLVAELRGRSFRPTVFVRYHEAVIAAVEPAP